MTQRASGSFTVRLTPMAPDPGVGDPSVGRLSIEKDFQGGLIAASKGQMLALRTPIDGSAGYVALEVVRGTLEGRSGSFALQHSGTMTRGAPQLVVTVVPDSGSEQLVGLVGAMKIVVEGGAHSYEFDFSLPDPS